MEYEKKDMPKYTEEEYSLLVKMLKESKLVNTAQLFESGEIFDEDFYGYYKKIYSMAYEDLPLEIREISQYTDIFLSPAKIIYMWRLKIGR